jgi:hypothetical protein
MTPADQQRTDEEHDGCWRSRRLVRRDKVLNTCHVNNVKNI